MVVVNKNNYHLLAKKINEGQKFMSFYVMQKYGRNLDSYFNQFNLTFSAKTIY